MCGRFSQFSSAEAIATTFKVKISDDLPPRYNVAPSQRVAAVLQFPDTPQRQLHWLRWGLIPSWAKDPTIGYKTINARSETAAEKPSFRQAFRHRRCLIPADGFYEWQRVEGSSRKKQPYFFSLQNNRPMAFAGLHEQWKNPTGEILETCTILTTTANDLVSPIHDSARPTLCDRMPVILDPQNYDLWIDPNFSEIDKLQNLLTPYPATAMQVYPVSSIVNSPKNDSLECQQPLS